MGMLSRFVQLFRSNVNHLLNQAEDPTKMLSQTLADMETAFAKAKEQVARSLADQKRLEKNLADQQTQVKKWSERAMLAVEKNDDDLAREALRRKQEHSQLAQQFEQELAAHTHNVEQLKASLHELEAKIGEIQRKKNLVISKQRRAEAQDQIYKTIEGVQGQGALATIQRMEEKVDDMTHLADARQELSHTFKGDDLEKKFQALSPGKDVETELLEMKQRLQLEHKTEPAAKG